MRGFLKPGEAEELAQYPRILTLNEDEAVASLAGLPVASTCWPSPSVRAPPATISTDVWLFFAEIPGQPFPYRGHALPGLVGRRVLKVRGGGWMGWGVR